VRIFRAQCSIYSSFWHTRRGLDKALQMPPKIPETPMTNDIIHLRETVLIAAESRQQGNHPFGALLAGPDCEVLLRCGNTHSLDGGPGHAEANVAREAARRFSPEFLSGCTLYSATEPCAMCTGATYWAGIGKVVFGLSEKRLAELTGDNPENLTLDLECRSVLATGRRPVEVIGPFAELEEEIVAVHKGFW
jgi:tRNA(Arg) A34 adenosine deaminase TadA